MSREVPFDKSEKCDICGKEGAFDFMGDFICGECFKTNEEVMKTAEPKIIYLQIGEIDVNELKKEDFETNAITWCWERIFDNDIEYISKSNLFSLIDEMIENNNLSAQSYFEDEEIGKIEGYSQALTELKQKIEELC